MEPSQPQNTKWVLTEESLDRLLSSLDDDRDQAGRKYEIIRLKLVNLFRWRGSVTPDDLTDETLNRVARKLELGEVIRDVQAYVGGVARLVWLESVKAQQRERDALDQLPRVFLTPDADPARQRLECFESCLASLAAENRDLIVDYHREEKHAKIELRKRLAQDLGIPLNALRIRAHRIRTELEKCVANCMRQSPE